MNPHGQPRVLQIGLEASSLRPGGLNRFFDCLVESLDDIGVPTRTITLGEPGDAGAGSGVVVSERGSLFRRLLAVRSAIRAEIGSVDVVDAHFALMAVPLFPRLLGGRPLLVHFQGPWADESAALGQSRVVCMLKRVVERLVYRRASGFVVLSRSFRRLLVERYGASPWDVAVVHPGVDTEQFSPGDRARARALLAVPSAAFVAVTVRRLVPRMGLDVMADAWAEVVSSCDRAAHWLVVGDGPERADLESRVSRLGLADQVHFLGSVSDEKLVDCYRAADVSVVPSVQLEGFGLVTLESLACGTPVVASDVDGLRDAVGGLSADMLVPPGDAPALAERLLGVQAGAVEIPGPADCRAYAERSSWESVAGRHVALFEAMVARSSSARGAGTVGDRGDLRVVVVGHTAVLSGGELAIVRLIEAMPGVKVHAILAEDGPLVRLLEEAGASVEVLPLHDRARDLRRGDVAPGRLPLRSATTTAVYTLRLARRLRQLQPDVVHTNTLKAALYGGVAAKLARRPCLWLIRDRIADDYLPALSVRVVRRLARTVPGEIVVDSAATRETLSAWQRPPAVAINTIPSPVRADLVPRDAGDGSADRLHFVMLGRLARWKGQDVFLRAFAEAFAGGGHRAIIAGASFFGEEAYGQELVDLAWELGIAAQVEFRGFVHDVPALLRDCDVLVHASLLPEPFGQVLVEAMATGCAVVAADGGGPSEIVTNGVDGVLVPPGDVGALAAALRRLAEDGALRSRLGEHAILSARRYAPALIAEKMLAIYERMSGKTSGEALVPADV